MSVELQPMVPRQARRRRGFSLVELGIVIAVIAVLTGVVIAGAGFFRGARQRTGVDLVLTLRGAAKQFSMRHQSGLRYGTSLDQVGTPDNVSLKQLMADNFLPQVVATPWNDPATGLPNRNITIGPIDKPANACADFACVVITMPVPAEECADAERTLVSNLQDKAVLTPTCNGTTLTVVLR